MMETTQFLHRIRDILGPPPSHQGDSFNFMSYREPRTWFVCPQDGNTGNDGRDRRRPLATIAGALAKCRPGDTVEFWGNVTEEITANNLLFDITIRGLANRPRHADAARDDIGLLPSGASWREAASHGASTSLLNIRAQGWKLENILFVPPSDAGAVQLNRNALSGASEFDASHAHFKNCRFAGGQDGIRDSGGAFNVRVEDCIFQAQTVNGILTVDTAVAVPLMWDVRDCYFVDNANHIRVSASKWRIHNNIFGPIGSGVGITLVHVAGQGAGNIVTKNYLSGDYDGEYLGGTGDEWAGNYSQDLTSDEVGGAASALNPLTTAAPIA